MQKHNAEDTSEEESDKEVCTAGLDLTGLCLFYWTRATVLARLDQTGLVRLDQTGLAGPIIIIAQSLFTLFAFLPWVIQFIMDGY